IDVAFDRLGDAVGGGMVRAVLVIAPAAQYSAILSLAMACSAAAMLVASRLNRGYIDTLEKSLLNRAVEVDLSDMEDATTRTLMVRTLRRPRAVLGPREGGDVEPPRSSPITSAVALDPELQEILWLRSRDRERV